LEEKNKRVTRFKNKVALITGGASGIGRAVVQRLTKEGAKIIIADCDVKRGNAVVKEVQDYGGSCFFQEVDLVNPKSITQLGSCLEKKISALHVLVNSAGIGCSTSIENTSKDDWNPLIAINLRAPALVAQSVLPLMKKEGGSIVNISSDGGLRGRGGCWTYDSSKAGVISLTKTMAVEFIKYKIRANAIAPGICVTPFHYGIGLDAVTRKNRMLNMRIDSCIMKRMGRSDEIASAIAFLASDEASYITGATLCVDGGRVGL
jgi:NAD(P)-dependent dehydrogenase (short-subunit alcohol dehydrogenase family)